MKPTLKLMVLLLMLFIQNTIYAQTILQKQVLVYFKTGVQRNDTPNQNTVTITSSNITRVLGKYGLSKQLSVTVVLSDFLPQQFCQHLMLFDALSKRFNCVQLHYTHLMPYDTF